MDMQFGWVKNEAEVEKQLLTMPKPLFGSAAPDLVADETKEVRLYDVVRKVIGKDAPKGPQGIGDCVSWGGGNFINYTACVQILDKLKKSNLLFSDFDDPQRLAIVADYEECATEASYALSRVEIGGQRGSYSDGSVGVWLMQSFTKKGTLSRKALVRAGLPGEYNKNRAKEWGAKGLPDELEPSAFEHKIKVASLVRSYKEAVAAIQNGYGVVVCSDQGFSMTRDSQGFCSPRGIWYHCMFFMANRVDRPGLCCSQSWGPNVPDGPLDKEQPDNSFWVDANVVDRMLRQGDSFTGSGFEEYIAQDVTTWRH
jgi:hypothetical protein